jgi:hypothetical protein
MKQSNTKIGIEVLMAEMCFRSADKKRADAAFLIFHKQYLSYFWKLAHTSFSNKILGKEDKNIVVNNAMLKVYFNAHKFKPCETDASDKDREYRAMGWFGKIMQNEIFDYLEEMYPESYKKVKSEKKSSSEKKGSEKKLKKEKKDADIENEEIRQHEDEDNTESSIYAGGGRYASDYDFDADDLHFADERPLTADEIGFRVIPSIDAIDSEGESNGFMYKTNGHLHDDNYDDTFHGFVSYDDNIYGSSDDDVEWHSRDAEKTMLVQGFVDNLKPDKWDIYVTYSCFHQGYGTMPADLVDNFDKIYGINARAQQAIVKRMPERFKNYIERKKKE